VKVRALRLVAGLTQKKTSELGDVNWRHWQKIEAAELNVTMATLVRVARVLRVDIPELFREVEQGERRAKPSSAKRKPRKARARGKSKGAS
jgi:transcriptional regulator with XRE-family HTH domain